jgi:uncharacterized protein (TIGR04255 family)
MKLHQSPLVYVLAQVRIAPVMKMADFVPEVQDRLRREGYPRFDEGQVQEVRFNLATGPLVSVQPRWEFQAKDGRSGIILTRTAVVVHTNQYDTYETFEAEIDRAARIIGEVVQPSLIERLGLRYVDLISPRKNESYTKYLKAGLHGLSERDLGVKKALLRSETVGDTDIGRLVVRCVQSMQATPLPPDLWPATLDFSDFQVPTDELVTVLDLDHYTETQRDFDVATVLDVMGRLHDALDCAFRAAVTDDAMKIWKAEVVR